MKGDVESFVEFPHRDRFTSETLPPDPEEAELPAHDKTLPRNYSIAPTEEIALREVGTGLTDFDTSSNFGNQNCSKRKEYLSNCEKIF